MATSKKVETLQCNVSTLFPGKNQSIAIKGNSSNQLKNISKIISEKFARSI